MAKGDGSIRKITKEGKQARDAQGRPIWEVRVSTGWDAGKRRYGLVTRRVHGTKAEARKVRDELNAQLSQGIDPNAGRMTFGEFANQWLEIRLKAEDWGERTKDEYRYRVRQVSEFLGDVPVKDVTPMAVESMYCELRERGLSNSTIRKVHVFVKRAFKYAVDNDAISRNPCDRVKPPKAEAVERRSLSAQEAARLLAAIEGEYEAQTAAEAAKEARRESRGAGERSYIRGIVGPSCLVAARLALATGARLGEVLGLQWAHFHEGARVLHIEQSLTKAGNLKKPKTRAGKRLVAIDQRTAAFLTGWREFQRSELRKIGVTADNETPICCDSLGGFVNLANCSHWWRGFADSHGFQGVKFHELRHTQATLLLAQGVDVKTVQNRLGHANASITLDWYAHALPENDHAAAGVLGDLLENPPQPHIVPFPKSA